ncbi:MAG TPA: hypothetical protein VEQ42_03680 [Pyrinomonadaceae bacterium]|nr:hypothetical protein [Pyrinomonadaceae bacterium]
MKHFYALAAACLLALALGAAEAQAQTRGRRTTTQRWRRAPATTPSASAAQLNAARLRVADQVKKMTRFLYLYGRFSKDLELTGTQAANADVAGRTRNELLNIVRGVREDLDRLEADFRLTPGLQRFFPTLEGVAERAAGAEAQVAANRLDQAGRTLVEVVNQLTDVLLEM